MHFLSPQRADQVHASRPTQFRFFLCVFLGASSGLASALSDRGESLSKTAITDICRINRFGSHWRITFWRSNFEQVSKFGGFWTNSTFEICWSFAPSRGGQDLRLCFCGRGEPLSKTATKDMSVGSNITGHVEESLFWDLMLEPLSQFSAPETCDTEKWWG